MNPAPGVAEALALLCLAGTLAFAVARPRGLPEVVGAREPEPPHDRAPPRAGTMGEKTFAAPCRYRPPQFDAWVKATPRGGTTCGS